MVIVYPPFVSGRASLLDLGIVPYREALDLQRSLAAAVAEGDLPDTVVLVEHPPVITTGRRTETTELHIPEGAAVELVETDRGGKSTYHAPGQLVCYPILDLHRHGKAVRKYVRDHQLLPTFRWALGSQQELEEVWRAYSIVVRPDVKDTVAHSTVQLLIDPTGHERLVYDANVQAADVIADLKTLQDE